MKRLSLLLLLMCLVPQDGFADTGLLREVVRTDDAHVLVFTAPASLRVGSSEVVVVVNHPSSGEPIQDVEILVKARMSEWEQTRPSMVFATVDDDDLRMARKATIDLPSRGDWSLEIEVHIAGGTSLTIPVDVFVSAPMPTWFSYAPVLLFWVPCVFFILLRDRILHPSSLSSPV